MLEVVATTNPLGLVVRQTLDADALRGALARSIDSAHADQVLEDLDDLGSAVALSPESVATTINIGADDLAQAFAHAIDKGNEEQLRLVFRVFFLQMATASDVTDILALVHEARAARPKASPSS